MAQDLDDEQNESEDIAGDNASEEDKEILRIAHERFQLSAEAETEIRQEALDDKKFRAGEQWDDEIKRDRNLDRRPCLTINRLPSFSRQITNDQRQNRPSVQVNPIDNKGDIETADVLQGIIRHIEYTSNADTAYDIAFEEAVNIGRGFFRVTTDYLSPMSFDQEIFFKSIPDSFKVYMDPHSTEIDGSDQDFCFVIEDLSKDDFKAQFPGSRLSMMEDWLSIGDQAPGWMQANSCRIAEYFMTAYEPGDIVLLSNGDVILKSQLPETLPETIKVIQERKTMLRKIKWFKINGLEILDRTEWLGNFIPIVPVYGDVLYIDGKKQIEGIIRHAKDPQRMYNYWASAETETIALAPRAPWIGAEGQFEGHEPQWKEANRRNIAFLQYKPKTIGGALLPPPTRNQWEPATQAITQARNLAGEDIKATTGIYDATLGNHSNEISGVAIQRRNHQSQTNIFHYGDNLTKSIRHAGRILIDLIPKVYTGPRAVRTIGADNTHKVVMVNKIFQEAGKTKIFNLGLGTYDVTVNTGPSFATKRQEAVQSMLDLTRSLPQISQYVADLLVRNMDWPGATEIADRLKKLLPPGLAENEDDGQKPIPPEIQQQFQQLQNMVKQLSEALNQANHKIETKSVEIESKERIAMAQIQLEGEIELARLGQKAAIVELEAQITKVKAMQDHYLQMQQMNAQAPAPGSDPNSMAGPPGAEQNATGAQG